MTNQQNRLNLDTSKTLGKAYALSIAATSVPIIVGSCMIAYSESTPIPELGTVFISIGAILGPFVGQYYFKDYKSFFIRSGTSAALVGGSFAFASFSLLASFSEYSDNTVYSLMALSGISAIGYLTNVAFGYIGLPESKNKYYNKLSFSPKFYLNNDKDYQFGLAINLPVFQ